MPNTKTDQETEAIFQRALKSHLDGRLDHAGMLYQETLRYKPDHVEALHNLGAIHLSFGENEKAIDLFKGALEIKADYLDALNNLATALKREKKYPAAIRAIEKVLSLKPDRIEAHFNLGNLYREIGQYEKAIEAYNRVILLNRNDHEAWKNLGAVLSLMGRFPEARDAAMRSLAIRPDQAAVHYNLGAVFLKEDRPDEAMNAFLKAVQLDPGFSDAYLNLGNILKMRGRMEEAERFFHKAVDSNPKSADAYYNLGLIFEARGDLDNELRIRKEALAACPDEIQSLVGGARTFSKIADWERVDVFLKQMAMHRFAESEIDLLSSALYLLHDFPVSNAGFFQKHCQYGDYAMKKAARALSTTPFKHSPGRYSHHKIRIGYVSPDFCRHSVGWFFQRIAHFHDRQRFEIFCYATDQRKDDLTEDVIRSVDAFRWVESLSPLDLAEKIFEDRIQILVDLAGHTRGHRLETFAFRPAPVQVTAIGYPNGTGLPTMDYRITDHHAETENSLGHYREKPIFLPGCFLPFGPISVSDAPLKRENLGLPGDGVLLVSFNRAGKLRPEVLSLWNRILTRCPEAIIALGCGNVHREDLRANILRYFPVHGERVFFLPREKTEEAARARYILADLALDSFPYAGTTTSYEALCMHVPVITLVGERHVQRTTYSILKHLGVMETISHTEEEYLDKAVDLIQQPSLLKEVQSHLGKSFKDILAYNVGRYTRNLERAYLHIWERYVSEKSPREVHV